MAQIGSPTANRTGLSIFWQDYWFSDTNFADNLHSVTLVKQFIYFFFLYGIIHNKHPWLYKSWLTSSFINLPSFTWANFFKYNRMERFKKTYFKTHIYYNRKPLPIKYITRIWVLKYALWTLIFWSFYIPKSVYATLTKPRLQNFKFNFINKLHTKFFFNLKLKLISRVLNCSFYLPF